MSRSQLLVAMLAIGATALPAQLDDAMWFASRQGRKLTKVSASGEVLQSVDLSSNGRDLSRVARMPDGRLWVINFITPTMTITDRNGGNVTNIDTTAVDPTRGAADVVFDRTGIAWVTFNAVSLVARYSPAGTLINTISVPAFPLAITCDNQGFIWVGHRSGPPSTISKIDPTTFVVQSFTLPSGTRTLGGLILADSPGITGNSQIWTAGDSGNEVVVFDLMGNHLNTYFLGSMASAGASALTLDGARNVWALHFRVASSRGDVYRLDRNTGAVLHSIIDAPEPVGLTTDSFGRAWYINRLTFSGPTEAEVRRADLTVAGTYEVNAPIGVGAYQSTDANGMHRAMVILPLADFDGDGIVNLIEAQNGTSPYDAQSNATNSLLTTGRTLISQTPNLEVRGAPGVMVLGFATGTQVSFNIPGIAGQLRLDPARILPITVNATVPSTIPFLIPNDPSLIGFALRIQGLRPGPVTAWTNDTAIQIGS